MKSTRRLVLLALMVAQALILSIIESWIPLPIAVPGIKLGLANIVTLITLTFFGFRDALFVVTVRCALSSLFGGGLIVFLFSITGGILSTIVMAFMLKKFLRSFSLYGISIAGAIVHNFGQLVMASIIMKQWSVMAYLPILLVSGIIMGSFVGLCSGFLSKALQKTHIFDRSE
ncbi:MAG: Gx transporter family protein [Clostridiales bacterium]|jgi:heptaprenyl diphosphate synthase|nr:Gx transporter family protein [Eubacteriales bacterium]MDH7566590.1 Gx transporter family protein [Clostridiales bacterium]